jgi:hypothetical protein
LLCSGILPANNEFLLQVKADDNSLEQSDEYSSCLGCGDVFWSIGSSVSEVSATSFVRVYHAEGVSNQLLRNVGTNISGRTAS